MDSGIYCLNTICHINKIPFDIKKTVHEFTQNGEHITESNIIRAANSLGFKSKAVKYPVAELNNSLLPAIGQDNEGNFFIIAKVRKKSNGSNEFLIKKHNQNNVSLLSDDELAEFSTQRLILFRKKSQPSNNDSFVFGLSWFIPALKKYKITFTEVIIASFFVQVFALATPLFFQVVMDKVIVHQGLTTLDVLGIGFLCIAIFEMLLGGLRNYLFSHTTNRVDVELGAKLYRHLLSLPLAYFESRQVGQNVARVRELENIRNFITGSALTLIIDLVFTLVFFAVMALYSTTLTLIVAATIPAYILLSIFVTPILRKRLEQKFSYGAQNQAFLVESITGAETIKSLSLEPNMQHTWENQLAEYVSSAFKSQHLSNIANQIAGFIGKLTVILIIWIGAYQVMYGDMTVGQLVAFNILAGRVTAPVLKLVQLWQDFQQAGISVKKLGEILNTPSETTASQTQSNLPSIKGDIDLNNVTFRYGPNSPAILDDFSLQIKAGEKIGIIGRSGSGKSTITKLVQRLYPIEKGKVCVDGLDLSTVDTTWLRKRIGIVLQNSFLFNKSIRENIAITNPAMPLERVIQVAKIAGAHDFIVDLQEGYDTMVTEMGANLSGGQRQRIAIARALITNPKILIMDEATSALDYESEKIIQNNMEEISKGRTVIIIAHRLTAVKDCDRIVVLEKGKIVEIGSQSELLKKNGYFSKLYNLQASDNI